MKAVLDMRPVLLVEQDVFGTLVGAFLRGPSADVQQSLCAEVLQFSQKLAAAGQTAEILDTLCGILARWAPPVRSSTAQRPSFVHLLLVQGWLDILLTKQTPKSAAD
jgi:hypothetical protein